MKRPERYPYTKSQWKRQRRLFIRIAMKNMNCLDILKTNSQEKE